MAVWETQAGSRSSGKQEGWSSCRSWTLVCVLTPVCLRPHGCRLLWTLFLSCRHSGACPCSAGLWALRRDRNWRRSWRREPSCWRMMTWTSTTLQVNPFIPTRPYTRVLTQRGFTIVSLWCNHQSEINTTVNLFLNLIVSIVTDYLKGLVNLMCYII